jgi:hypothetical protein
MSSFNFGMVLSIHLDASSSRVDLPVGQGRATTLPTANLLGGIVVGLSSFTTIESS